ncbi:unnamed protein product [Staurois parvus]|uniref:Maturase K n=1 Tax=Staurois parvus TaxID=386267 RepID=A0ABN9EA54_9NEOB|nr:unnamed protein product [Staurois parvus]
MLVNAPNHVYKRLKFYFNSSSSRCCPESFFHYEKCIQRVFKVLRWTKH